MIRLLYDEKGRRKMALNDYDKDETQCPDDYEMARVIVCFSKDNELRILECDAYWEPYDEEDENLREPIQRLIFFRKLDEKKEYPVQKFTIDENSGIITHGIPYSSPKVPEPLPYAPGNGPYEQKTVHMEPVITRKDPICPPDGFMTRYGYNKLPEPFPADADPDMEYFRSLVADQAPAKSAIPQAMPSDSLLSGALSRPKKSIFDKD